MSQEIVGDQSQYKRYVGWTTEKLLSNIVVKIRGLKTTVEMDPDNVKIRKRVRLINILKLTLLLIKHINS